MAGEKRRRILPWKTVTGKVISTAEGPITCRSYVLLKGSTKGTTTDVDGNYSIKVVMMEASWYSLNRLHTQEIQMEINPL